MYEITDYPKYYDYQDDDAQQLLSDIKKNEPQFWNPNFLSIISIVLSVFLVVITYLNLQLTAHTLEVLLKIVAHLGIRL